MGNNQTDDARKNSWWSDDWCATKRRREERKEKEWGNSMIGQTNNGQWTTLLGETLVYDLLTVRGENPRKVARKGGFEPDWETDKYIYEVKTSNWWVRGTVLFVYTYFIFFNNDRLNRFNS